MTRLVWLLTSITLAASCGGTTETTQTATGGSAGAAGQSSGGSGPAAGSGGTAGSGGLAGTGGTQATGGVAGAAAAGGVAGAAGIGGQPIDAGVPGISCGNGVCSIPAEYCCVSYQSPGSGDCKPASDLGNCTGGSSIAMACDGPEDCAGQACCGTNGSGLPWVGAIQCSATCPLDGMHAMFCHPNAPDVCPNGYGCKPTPLLSSYASCQPL